MVYEKGVGKCIHSWSKEAGVGGDVCMWVFPEDQ